MKRNICEFITKYLLQVEENDSFKVVSLQEILNSPYKNQFSSIRNNLIEIKLEDEKAFDNLIKLDTDGILYDYLKIMQKYIEEKKKSNYTISDISKKSNLPELTIKRFENLQCIANSVNLLKILKTINLHINFE